MTGIVIEPLDGGMKHRYSKTPISVHSLISIIFPEQKASHMLLLLLYLLSGRVRHVMSLTDTYMNREWIA